MLARVLFEKPGFWWVTGLDAIDRNAIYVLKNIWKRLKRNKTIENLSVQIVIELPESAFSALRTNPNIFVGEMRLAAAIKWYELGRISQSKAAEIAGISRHEFLNALWRYDVSPFQVTPEELVEELNRD